MLFPPCVFVQESVNKQRPKKIFADAKEVEITRAIAEEFHSVLQERAECDVIVIGAGPAGLTAVSYTHLTLPTNREV